MSSERWLIVGLGNPGPGYSHNRHNVGYWCVNRLARLHGVQLRARKLAAIGQGAIGPAQVVLLKPRTFVNQSGRAVAVALKQAGIPTERLLVICDELDLPTGKLRLRPTGSHGGHNGIRSIIASIGSTNFPRLRIGIGRPVVDGEPVWDPKTVADWVLSDPTPAETQALQSAVARAAEAVETLLREGVDAAMRAYNR